jgi:RNA polymerase sigma factor (sigma-70 family)
METVDPTRGARRHNRSLRHLAPLRSLREPAGEADDIQAAFESFYREHVTGVYQYALAVLANPADAEDVTQQTFLNAYRAFQRGERPHRPHNWLIKIAHNVCRMRWRQSARRPQELPLEDAREPAVAEDDKPALDEVLRALGRLPFNQRAAIVMRELEDRSYAEIADVLGTSVSAVEALLFRARTNLRARRKAIGVLTLVPVPGSLASFFGKSGGGLLAAGGAAVGTEFVLKAAAVVATSVVVGSVGFKGADAIATSDPNGANVLQQDYKAPGLGMDASKRLAAAAGAIPQAARGSDPTQAGRDTVAPGNNDARIGEATPESAAAAAGVEPAPAAVNDAAPAVAAPEPAATVDDVVASIPQPQPAPTPAPVPQAPAPVPQAPAPVPTAPAPVPTAPALPALPLPTVPITVPAVTVPSLPG